MRDCTVHDGCVGTAGRGGASTGPDISCAECGASILASTGGDDSIFTDGDIGAARKSLCIGGTVEETRVGDRGWSITSFSR